MSNDPKIVFDWPNEGDLPDLVTIYNQAIRSGEATGHTREILPEDRADWIGHHAESVYPMYVMKMEGKLVGYGTFSPYREGRQAMRTIAEVSFFIDEAHHGKRLGDALLQEMIREAPVHGFETLLAFLLDVNKRSIGLLEKHGFTQWGHFKDVIKFKDKTCGHLIYGLKIKA